MKTLEQLGISPAPWRCLAGSPHRKDTIVWCEHNGTSGMRRTRIVAVCNAMASENAASGDASLIAAAPELYEALAALLNCAEKEAPFTTESGMSIAMDMARKAIAKAGGEE